MMPIVGRVAPYRLRRICSIFAQIVFANRGERSCHCPPLNQSRHFARVEVAQAEVQPLPARRKRYGKKHNRRLRDA
jgi:hypothetical protein